MADASALVAEALRDRGRRLIRHDHLALYITPLTLSETLHEIRRRIDAMMRHGQVRPERRDLVLAEVEAMLDEKLRIVTEADFGQYATEARDRIPRDARDWPTVALALELGIGIWTADRDFFGCGIPVWTTETLSTHVRAGRAHRDA